MSNVHPKIINAMKTGMLLSDAEVHEVIRMGAMIFTTQNFLNSIARDYTATHLKASLDFIEKFLGNYQEVEETASAATGDRRLSYFSVNDNGRDGYCIRCTPSTIEFLRITSLDGMPTYKVVMSHPLK